MLRYLKHLLFVSAVFTLFSVQILGCKNNVAGNDSTSAADTIKAPSGYQLVWHDEFSGDKVDASKWSYEVNGNGGGNNELQYYTDLPENSYLENGSLVIQALQKDYLGKHYTSARMRTLNKGDWTYGRIEVRAKLPYGQGLWPAIWMLPTDWEYGGWPASGEIDIMELLGNQTNKIYGTIHYGSSSKDHQQSGGSFLLPSGTFAQDYHIFAIDWDSTGITWYVDGLQYFKTVHGKPFDKRFHILLNVAVGGNWPGDPDQSTRFPQKMYVDYVRVFQKIK